MLKILKSLISEKSTTKIAGIYNSEPQAQRAAEVILRNPSMNGYRVKILHPYEANAQSGTIIKAQSDKSIIESHLILASLGAFVGLMVYAILLWSNNPSIISTPLESLVALIGFGITSGLLLSGFLSLPPEHIRLMGKIKEQLELGNYAVIVHRIDDSDTQRAIDSVRDSTNMFIRTL